jgi:hypothetical protein
VGKFCFSMRDMARTYLPNRTEPQRGGGAFGQLFESYPRSKAAK